MGIVGYVAREGIRAATKPPQQPPRQAPPGPRQHPGTVVVRDGTLVQAASRRRAEPIDGALLWALTSRYLAFYVAFRTREELTRAIAWAFHATARKRGELGIGPLIWNATPRLLVKSRTRGAGKSTLLDLLVYLTGSRRGKTPRITPARLAQIIGQAHEAVFVDEGRLVFGAGARHQDLQACLLVGYTPNGSYEVSKTSLSVFGPVAIAAKESLITEASKAVDGDESSLGDLLDRCLTITLAAPDFPVPEVGKRARAEGELLARALVAWTDAYGDALEQAAEDIAGEDYEAAQERARLGEKQTETPRALQIGRPLRAVGRVIDQQVIMQARRAHRDSEHGGRACDCPEGFKDPEPQCEAEILACLGTQTEDIMAELEGLSQGWGDAQFTGDAEDTGDGELDEWPGTSSAVPGQTYRWPTESQATTQYIAGYAQMEAGKEPVVEEFPEAWWNLDAAIGACDGHARGKYGYPERLVWDESETTAGMLGATIYPDGSDGPEVAYAIREIQEG